MPQTDTKSNLLQTFCEGGDIDLHHSTVHYGLAHLLANTDITEVLGRPPTLAEVEQALIGLGWLPPKLRCVSSRKQLRNRNRT